MKMLIWSVLLQIFHFLGIADNVDKIGSVHDIQNDLTKSNNNIQPLMLKNQLKNECKLIHLFRRVTVSPHSIKISNYILPTMIFLGYFCALLQFLFNKNKKKHTIMS